MINSLVDEGHRRLYFNPDFSFLRHCCIHDPAGAGISQGLVQCPQITERFRDGAVENNFPFFGVWSAAQFIWGERYNRLLNTFTPQTPLRFPPQIGVVASPNCLFEIFQCFASTFGPVVVWAQSLGSGRGQVGLKQPLLLANWDTSCFAVFAVSLKENTPDMKSFVLT